MTCSWHQDLKPANILVVVAENASAYRGISFKVADMGLSHFKTIMDGDAEAVDLDTYGTRTYGVSSVRMKSKKCSDHLIGEQELPNATRRPVTQNGAAIPSRGAWTYGHWAPSTARPLSGR